MAGHQGGVAGPGARIGGLRHRESGHVDREPDRGVARVQQDKYPGVVGGGPDSRGVADAASP